MQKTSVNKPPDNKLSLFQDISLNSTTLNPLDNTYAQPLKKPKNGCAGVGLLTDVYCIFVHESIEAKLCFKC